MALIEYGSFENFAVSFQPAAFDINESVRGLTTFSAVREATRRVQGMPIEFKAAVGDCGIALKSIKLDKKFGGFFNNYFDRNHNIYFLAWSWDLSGNPPEIYPAQYVTIDQIRIPIKAGDMREFLGDGVLLFPPKKITSGLALRINLWESDENIRQVGKTIVEVTDTIKNSKLNAALSMAALVTGVPGATIGMFKEAATELSSAVGQILKANSDDYVDFFEGYYPVQKWTPGEETARGHGCEIVLNKI